MAHQLVEKAFRDLNSSTLKKGTNGMKKMKALATVLMTAALAGCVVTSVSPYYTEKDLVLEPGLVGNWLKQVKDSQPEVWKFEKSGELAYRFTLIEEGKATVMEAHAFRLQGQLFIDVFSLQGQDIHVIPPHYLLKVSQLTSPSLQLAQLDNDWLKQFLTANPTAIAHHMVGEKTEDLRVVLTADTAALQEFIMANLTTEGMWKDSFDLQRE